MIPVVLIHQGFDAYLNYSLEEARKRNRVVLISDHRYYADTEYIDLKSCWGGCDDFQKSYTHLSTDSYDYGLFCFQRWLVLQNYMQQAGVPLVFYIDSDVMLYVNVNEEWPKYQQFDLTLAHRAAPVCSFFTKTGLDRFVTFFVATFRNQNGYDFEKIASHYHIRTKHGLGGGITDMAYFDFFHYHAHVGGGPGKVGEMMTIIDDATYDHCINLPGAYFEMDQGRKKIVMRDGMPYCFSTKLQRLVKFHALHFQGKNKVHMGNYLS